MPDCGAVDQLVIFCTALLRSSDNTSLLVWSAIGFCAGLYLFFQGFRLLQRRRLILDTPSSKIRSAAMGMVEISGLAAGPYTMAAPITTRPCYYYRTVVWEWKRRGKSSSWVKVAAECMHVPFFLDDNTGRVMVDPRGAELDLHRDFQQEFCDSFFTTKDPAPDNVRSFLARHGIATSNKIKVEEFCIKPKNSLFVLGTLAENPGLEVGPQPIHDAEATTLFCRRCAVHPSIASGMTSSSYGSGGSSDFDDRGPGSGEYWPNHPRSHATQVIRLSTDAEFNQSCRHVAAAENRGCSHESRDLAILQPGRPQELRTRPCTSALRLSVGEPANMAPPQETAAIPASRRTEPQRLRRTSARGLDEGDEQ